VKVNPIKITLVSIVFIVGLWGFANMFVSVDQNDIMVVQNPVSGYLTWYTTGGAHLQWFGKVTKYHKRTQFWFSLKPDQGSKADQSIIVRFNDGGHANLSGSIAWEMPLDEQHLNLIHQKYGSQEAVEQQLVRTIVEKCVYMTGPLMSSAESYAERRNDLIQLIEDQVQNGVLQTQNIEQKQSDPITGEMKTVTVVQLKSGPGGAYLRQEESPLRSFGIKTFNLSLNNVKYDDRVESQIQQQQQAKMQVQTAIANAKMAEQAAITAAKNGEAEAAKAKWEQEVIKARAVTEGQQKLAVAQLDTQSAEQYKKAQILRGEGDGAYKKAVMQSDGALDKKIAAWIEVQKAYADALGKYQGNITPTIVSGSDGKNSSALGFMELLQMKAAKDLALDISLPSGNQTKK